MNEDLEKLITNKMLKSIEEEFSNNLFGSFSTHTNIQNETLTLEKYQEMIFLIFPRLYYATADYCQKGQMYICEETEFNPEYIIFHPDDFENIKENLKERTLVHINDEPEKDSKERLLNNLRKYSDDLFKKEMDNFKYRTSFYLNYNWMNDYSKGES